jgi:hypothetical protein
VCVCLVENAIRGAATVICRFALCKFGPPPILNQVNFVSRDIAATATFYRRLGLLIDAKPGAEHAAVTLANRMLLEFDSAQFEELL